MESKDIAIGTRVRVLPLDGSWTEECRRLLPGKLGTVERSAKRGGAWSTSPALRWLVVWDEPVTLHPRTENTGFWFEPHELEPPPGQKSTFDSEAQ